MFVLVCSIFLFLASVFVFRWSSALRRKARADVAACHQIYTSVKDAQDQVDGRISMLVAEQEALRALSYKGLCSKCKGNYVSPYEGNVNN